MTTNWKAAAQATISLIACAIIFRVEWKILDFIFRQPPEFFYRLRYPAIIVVGAGLWYWTNRDIISGSKKVEQQVIDIGLGGAGSKSVDYEEKERGDASPEAPL